MPKSVMLKACLLILVLLLPGHAIAKDVTLRFATLTSISKAPPAVAAEAKGFFLKYGVSVETKFFTSGRTAIEALAAGQFDIGMFGDIPALSLLAQGYHGKIIAAGLGGPKRQALMVKLGSRYRSLADLKGKRIGLTQGSTDEIALEATMKKQSLTWRDFNIVNLTPPAKPTALKLGDVDAIEAWEPIPSIIVVNKIGRRLLTADGDIPDIVGITLASDKILKEHPKAVVKFLKALNESAEYAQSHPNLMVSLLAEKLKIARPVLVEAIPTQWWYIKFFSDTYRDWQRSADLIYRLGRSKERLHVEHFVDTSFLSKALNESFPLNQSASQAMEYPKLTANK